MSGPDVALATCRQAWREDDDAAPLLRALEAVGATASLRVWDDPEVDWSAHDLVVIRSTWDYVPRRAEFLAWTERVARLTRLANPPEVVRWNTDKRYLAELAAEGVPVVPTTFLSAGGGPGRAAAAAAVTTAIERAAAGPGGFVVKPTVSAGARDTVRYPAGPGSQRDAVAQVAELLGAGRDAMVQPYLDGVDTRGETGVVLLDGRFSHAFRKGPLLEVGGGPVTGLYARESIDPRDPDGAELDLAVRVSGSLRARFGTCPLYARVDLVPAADGRPVLLEVELTEPSLFLATDPRSPLAAAEAIVRAAARP